MGDILRYLPVESPLSPFPRGGAINRPFDSLLSDGGNHLALMKLSYEWNWRERERERERDAERKRKREKIGRRGIIHAVIMEKSAVAIGTQIGFHAIDLLALFVQLICLVRNWPTKYTDTRVRPRANTKSAKKKERKSSEAIRQWFLLGRLGRVMPMARIIARFSLMVSLRLTSGSHGHEADDAVDGRPSRGGGPFWASHDLWTLGELIKEGWLWTLFLEGWLCTYVNCKLCRLAADRPLSLSLNILTQVLTSQAR